MIRKSGRNRRKPDVFVPGNAHLAPVNEELSNDGGSEAEEGFEEDDGEEESKTNRLSFSPSQTKTKPKRAPKAAAPKAKRAKAHATSHGECVLFDAIAGGASQETIATDWLSSFNVDPGIAQADMLNFLLLSCGGKPRTQERIDVDDLEPEDWKAMMDDVIEVLREQPTSGTGAPPDLRDKKFRASFLSFWGKLARACTLRQHNIRDGSADAAVDSTVTMLVYLSSSSVYQVREYCTSAGLEFGLEVALLISELNAELDVAKGRLTGQQHSQKNQSIAKQVRGYQQDLDRLMTVADNIYNSILMHRYKDTQPEVRATSIEYLGRWMECNPKLWLLSNERPSIQYPGWMLSDASAKVRLAAIQAIDRVVKKGNQEALEAFVDQFLPRVVEMTRDTEEAVAVATLKMLRGCQAVDLLDAVEDAVIDQVDEMVFDVEAPYSVRCEALGFVIDHTTGFEDLASNKQSRKTQKKGTSATERKSKICLQLQTLAQFVEHHTTLHANGAEPDLTFADLLVQAAVSSNLKECIWEWSSYVAILLSDSTIFTGEPFTPLQSRILVRMLLVAAVMVHAESASDIPIPLPILDHPRDPSHQHKILLEPQRVWSLRDFIEIDRQENDEDDDGTFVAPNNTTLQTSMSILQSLNQSKLATQRGRRGNKKLKQLDRDDLTHQQEAFTVHLVQCLPALLSRYCDEDIIVAMLLECVCGLDLQLCSLPAHQAEARKLIKDIINLLTQTQSLVVTRPLSLAILHCLHNDSLRKADVSKLLQQSVTGLWDKIQQGHHILQDESAPSQDDTQGKSKKGRRSSKTSGGSANNTAHRVLPLQAALDKLRWLVFGGDCRKWVQLSEDELYDVLPEIIDSATDFQYITTNQSLDLQPRFKIVCDSVYILTSIVLWRLHEAFDQIRAHKRIKQADKENEDPDDSNNSEVEDEDADDEGVNPARAAIASMLTYREKLVDVITTLMNLTTMTGNPDDLNTTSVSLFAQGVEDDVLTTLESNYLHAIKRFCFALVGDLRAVFKPDLRQYRYCEDLAWEPPREVLNAMKDYFDAEAARVQDLVNRHLEQEEDDAELEASPRTLDNFVADIMLQPLSRSILANPSTLNRCQAGSILSYIVDQGPETTELVRTVAQKLKEYSPTCYLEIQMAALKSSYEQQVLPFLHQAEEDGDEDALEGLKDQLAGVLRLSTRLCQTMGVGQAREESTQTALLKFFQIGINFGCSDLHQVLFLDVIAPYQRLLWPEGKQHVINVLDNAVVSNDRLQELTEGSGEADELSTRSVQAVNNLRFALTGAKPSKQTPAKKVRGRKAASPGTTKQPRAGGKTRKRRKHATGDSDVENSSGDESDNFDAWLQEVSAVHETPDTTVARKGKAQQAARKQPKSAPVNDDDEEDADDGSDEDSVHGGRVSKTVVKKRKNKSSTVSTAASKRNAGRRTTVHTPASSDRVDFDDAASVTETLPSRTVKKQKRSRKAEAEPQLEDAAVSDIEDVEEEAATTRRSGGKSKRGRRSEPAEEVDNEQEADQPRSKKQSRARRSRSSARSQEEAEQDQEDDALFADLDMRPSARLRYR